MSTPLAPADAEILAVAGVSTIANALLRHGLRNVVLQGVTALAPSQRALVGPAYTLRFIPAREDLDSMAAYASDDNLHRRAIEEAPPGAVLVIDAGGSLAASSMGDMMATRLAWRGVAGVVTDGGFRDGTGIAATGLPCFQRGPALAATPIALHPQALDEPIGCAGVAIYPGDLIVGDADGVVAIPAHLVREVVDAVTHTSDYEQYAEQQLRDGRSILGLFPGTDDNRHEYDAWVAAGRPGTE